MIKTFSWNRYCPLCYRELKLGFFHSWSHITLRNVCFLDPLFLTFFLGSTQQCISTLRMAKSLRLFSSFLKTFLRSAGSITLCNPGVNLCQGVSQESLRILYSILKAMPDPVFEPNGAAFANLWVQREPEQEPDTAWWSHCTRWAPFLPSL